MLPFCFQLQCQARRPLFPVSGAIVDEWPGLWVLSCQVTHSASCLTAVPVPLPAVGIPAPVLGKLALKKPDSIAGHTAFFSAAPVLGPALRSASSLHCYKLFFFWYLALSTVPSLIASCYKLFLKLPSIMLFTHAFRRTLCHVEC